MTELRNRGEEQPLVQTPDDDDDLLKKVKRTIPRFDVFPKIAEDHIKRTNGGGIVSIITYVLMSVLFLSETAAYFSTNINEKMRVDHQFGDKLRINIDVTFHAITCAEVEIIAMDTLGQHQLGIDTTTHKHRIDQFGKPVGEKFLDVKPEDKLPPLPDDYCGSCFGAVDASGHPKCCNTCSELHAAYTIKGWSTSDLDRTAEQCVLYSYSLYTILTIHYTHYTGAYERRKIPPKHRRRVRAATSTATLK
jgi:hypothetical protein